MILLPDMDLAGLNYGGEQEGDILKDQLFQFVNPIGVTIRR